MFSFFISVRNITVMNLKPVTRLTCGLIITCVLLPVVASFSQSLDGKQFAAVIKELASDGLGVEEYQVRISRNTITDIQSLTHKIVHRPGTLVRQMATVLMSDS